MKRLLTPLARLVFAWFGGLCRQRAGSLTLGTQPASGDFGFQQLWFSPTQNDGAGLYPRPNL